MINNTAETENQNQEDSLGHEKNQLSTTLKMILVLLLIRRSESRNTRLP